MSYKLALVFLVGLVAFAGAVPVDNSEQDAELDAVVADTEKEVPLNQESVPEEKSEGDQQEFESDLSEDENQEPEDDLSEDELNKEPENDKDEDESDSDKEEKPENELDEAKRGNYSRNARRRCPRRRGKVSSLNYARVGRRVCHSRCVKRVIRRASIEYVVYYCKRIGKGRALRCYRPLRHLSAILRFGPSVCVKRVQLCRHYRFCVVSFRCDHCNRIHPSCRSFCIRTCKFAFRFQYRKCSRRYKRCYCRKHRG